MSYKGECPECHRDYYEYTTLVFCEHCQYRWGCDRCCVPCPDCGEPICPRCECRLALVPHHSE